VWVCSESGVDKAGGWQQHILRCWYSIGEPRREWAKARTHPHVSVPGWQIAPGSWEGDQGGMLLSCGIQWQTASQYQQHGEAPLLMALFLWLCCHFTFVVFCICLIYLYFHCCFGPFCLDFYLGFFNMFNTLQYLHFCLKHLYTLNASEIISVQIWTPWACHEQLLHAVLPVGRVVLLWRQYSCGSELWERNNS
jgi:hypothetical protein